MLLANHGNASPEENNLSCQTMTVKRYQNLIPEGIALFRRATESKGIITLADQVIASATNFLTGVIVGRSCTIEQFGLYILGFSVLLFMMCFQNSIISAPYTVYSPCLTDRERALYTGSTLIHQLALSALLTICLLAAGGALSLGIGPKDLAPVIWALTVTFCLILLREYIRRIFFARLSMLTALALDSCVACIQIGGLLLLAYTGALSAAKAYLVIGAACGIAAISWLVWARMAFVVRLAQIISDLRRNWAFGKWFFASTLVFLMSTQLIIWFLNGFHGTGPTGVLAACMGVVFLSNPFSIGMSNLIGPKASRAYALGEAKKVRLVVVKSSVLLAVVMGLFCLLIFIFGDQLVVLIYGSKYAGHGAVVSVLALGNMAAATAMPITHGLLVMRRPKADLKVNLIFLSIMLTLGLWLAYTYGALGVAFGLLAGKLTALITRWITFTILVSHASSRPISQGAE